MKSRMCKNNYVAILAGGVGSRFWPVSRSSYPKQFLDILNTGKTLLQSTFERFESFIPLENIYIITSSEYVDIVREQLPNIPLENIIGEPERKNTAPCVAYIAMKLQQINPNANLIVAPSDHLIESKKQFKDACNKALAFTEINSAFVTLGIKPTYANTGYGYIEYNKHQVEEGIFNVNRFTEKPDIDTAIAFYNNGCYLWNAGIFIWKVKDILKAFKLHSPTMFHLFADALFDYNTHREANTIKRIYAQCESISIDYAIMEKVKNIFVIPAEFTWSDLGTWNSAWENTGKDVNKNAVNSDNVLMVDSNGCMVHSNGKKLVVIGGVDDLIIVNTNDALLVCKKENEQQIKEYLEMVKQTKGELYL